MNKYRAEGGIWAEDPEYPATDWREEAANDDTRLGYWEWIDNQRGIDDNMPPQPPPAESGYTYWQLIDDLSAAAALINRIGAAYDGRVSGWSPANLIYEAGYLLHHVTDLTAQVEHE